MPSVEAILASLSAIANDAFVFAIVWHVLVAAALIGFVARPRARGRLASLLASVPFVSVSAFAWAYGNPFNGAVFALLAATLALLAWRSHEAERAPRPKWAIVSGGLLLGFAWTYPHFLDRGPFAYLVGAPMGLIPCPTLALVLGFALVGAVRPGRAWALVLAGAGALYALIGVLRLGVVLDLPLLAGAIALAVTEASARQTAPSPTGVQPGGPALHR